MSLRLRLSVLVLFVSVLFIGNPVPLRADCDYLCETIDFNPPYWRILCYEMWDCVYAEDCDSNCRVEDCSEVEPGANILLECFI